MKWYWKTGGSHVHVRVFMNGALCGELCFRYEEFQQIKREALKLGSTLITFIEEN